MYIKQIPESMLVNIKDKIEELIYFLHKKELTLPTNATFSIEELEYVMLFSDFVASSLIKNPALLVDLIESGDLERSYSDGEYKLNIDDQIQNQVNTIINNILINDNSLISDDPLINDNVLIKFDDATLKEMLGRIREREMVRIAWQDIVGKVSLEQTLKDLSNLAEAFVDKVITFIYDKLCFIYGTPLNSQGNIQKPIVLGMGKLGAEELNFSSDIDLIFAYPEDLEFDCNAIKSGNGNKKLNTINTTGEFFTKMCKNFLKVFDSSTVISTTSNSNQCSASCSSSMLFRVDTRLRPFGANGPIAMSFYTMEEYYQTQGRDWERYALIKARPIAGDIAAGYTLLKILNPFIYRRYFDYGSFDSLRDMKKRISLQVKDKRFKNNIKLGAGGIREIEFFGQVFQLIRGGVEPEFQERKILKVLELLVQRNCIDAKTCEELTEAYCFLRKVEHRLQEYNDRQTHDLPEKDDEKLRLALSMGFVNNFNYSDFQNQTTSNCSNDKSLHVYSDDKIVADFYEVLNGYMSKVHDHFRNLFASDNAEKQNNSSKQNNNTKQDNGLTSNKKNDSKTEDEIDDLKYIWQNINDPQFDAAEYKISGFKNHQVFTNILKNLAEHQNTKKLTTTGRKRLDRLIPLLVQKVSQTKDSFCTQNTEVDLSKQVNLHREILEIEMSECIGSNPETVLKRLIDLIITIQRRTCYLSLLIEKPQSLDNLVNLAAKSPWVISFLSLHPALLDELLAPSTLYTPPDRAEMEKEIERRMAHIPVEDFEFQLEELCIFKQVMVLRVAAADLSGNYPLMKVSDRLTEIAETVMNKVIEISWNHTVQKYGVPSGLNLGKLSDINSDKDLDCLSDNDKFDYSSNDTNKNIKSSYLAPKIGFYPSESPLSTTYSASTCSKFFSPGFAAIAYGKLGGIELGYKSDLDMVFIHSSCDGYTEDGPRSIENIKFYTFLGQRIISALTLNTQAGKLYDADMRLRPNGQAGMIVSHIDAFHDYIKNEAWTWEHQAIIRARPIGGDTALQEQFNAIRESILCIERSPELLKKDVGEMRERMRKEHLKSSKDSNDLGKANSLSFGKANNLGKTNNLYKINSLSRDSFKSDSDLFDLKQGRGGIIDIEFLVQYLVLQYASEHRALTKWTDNVRLLETLASENILKPQESEKLKKGYLKLRQMVHHLNLQEREKKIPIKEFKDEANSIIEIFDKFLLSHTI